MDIINACSLITTMVLVISDFCDCTEYHMVQSLIIQPGQSFEIKLNFTQKKIPTEFSFTKLFNNGGQHKIKEIYLQYLPNGEMTTGTTFDKRVSFTGNITLGQVWFKFADVMLNDTSLYGVIYMYPNSVAIWTETIDVTVVNEVKRENSNLYSISTSPPHTQVLSRNKASEISRKMDRSLIVFFLMLLTHCIITPWLFSLCPFVHGTYQTVDF